MSDKKNVLIVGPFLSRSGYGEMARFALRSMKTKQDKYNIYLHNKNHLSRYFCVQKKLHQYR